MSDCVIFSLAFDHMQVLRPYGCCKSTFFCCSRSPSTANKRRLKNSFFRWLFAKKKWFFVNFTVIFSLLRDNPVNQYFQLEHERYRPV